MAYPEPLENPAGQAEPGVPWKDKEREAITEKSIADLRLRLLDLSNRNRLLNFKFSDRLRSHVRVIDELPDLLHAQLLGGRKPRFQPLPEPPDEPEDEKSPEFLRALEEAILTDEQYRREMEELGSGQDDPERAQAIERSLRNRLRAALGMKPWLGDGRLRPVDYATSLGWNPSFDLPTPASGEERDRSHHEDDLIRTLLFPDQMERKLAGIRGGARASLEELGVPTLFVAFGFLEWYEVDSSGNPFFAPLLLHPAELTQELVRHRYRFSIASTGEETEVNLTLRERLRKDFRLELPEFGEEETPEGYFTLVARAIAERKKWKVRRFVTVGLFSFGRLVMYQDLDPARWPAHGQLTRQPILLDLLGGRDPGDAMVAQDYEVDEPAIKAKVPILISEADSSQFSAIVDVMGGRSMAIKGPPGTGKSQTITNIVAAALAMGKRVLFVAEKMAALEVVKNRLDAAGLGDFCLELHSTKARKAEILDSLRRRLDIFALEPPRDFAESLQAHEEHRRQLTEYVRKLNTPLGHTGRTLQEVLWRATRARDRARSLGIADAMLTVDAAGALCWSWPEVETKRSAQAALEKKARDILERYPSIGSHPWACLGLSVRSPFELDDAIALLGYWAAALGSLSRAFASATSELGELVPPTLAGARDLVRYLRSLPVSSERVIAQALPGLRDSSRVAALERYHESLERFSKVWEELRESFPCAPDDLPTEEAIPEIHRRFAECRVAKGRKATVEDVSSLAEKCQSLGERVRSVRETAERILTGCGWADPATVDLLSAGIRSLSVLREFASDVFDLRSPEIYGAATKSRLMELEETATLLSQEREALRGRCVFSYGESPADYRNCAQTLRLTGFIGRILGKGYRRAKKAWALLQKEKRSARAFLMAQDLDEVAAHLERYQEFAECKQTMRLCGRWFRGLETPFDLLRQANSFGERVERELVGRAEANHRFKTLLLEGESTILDRLKVTVTREKEDEARVFLDDLDSLGFDVGSDDMEALESSLLEASENLRALSAKIARTPLRGGTLISALPRIAEKVARLKEAKEEIRANAEAQDVLGRPAATTDEERTQVAATLEFTRQVRAASLPDQLRDWVFSESISDRLATASRIAEAMEAALSAELKACEEASSRGGIECSLAYGVGSGDGLSLADAAERLESLLRAPDGAREWMEVCRLRTDVEELGLGGFLKAVWGRNDRMSNLVAFFDYAYLTTLLREAFNADPTLARLSGMRLEETRRRFQELDRAIVKLQRQKLAADLSRANVPQGIGVGPKRQFSDLALIRHEIGKRKRHIPLRDLLRRSYRAIQCLKPCWMMSPASVAQFVPPGPSLFDLVVIDEASQMKPEEALGAIARGRQPVVVGDPMQLPPTSFFDPGEPIDEESEDIEDKVDSESILDMALAVFHPHRDLRWHYRSRHESLVAFSNRHFYESRLVVFPASKAKHPLLGVEYRKVDGQYTKGGTNVPELIAVADAAGEHMRLYPDRSLGIVTMNLAQAELLQDEMDRRFALDEGLEEYRANWAETLESFFVKNLERVQGDERDVIFISMVYGPDETGRVLQRFGPINSAMGHRRLNVLFTRAKHKVVAFSSMRSSDVVPGTASNAGVWILKRYLEYAETGHLEHAEPSGRPPDSDFEVAVADRLRNHGFSVAAQVGVAGYFIDLAVRSPLNPDSYLLGIECDGATYHSAKSARDRDRLRQEVLESRGWKLYRIWSTDWYGDPDRETNRLVALLERLAQDEQHSGGSG